MVTVFTGACCGFSCKIEGRKEKKRRRKKREAMGDEAAMAAGCHHRAAVDRLACTSPAMLVAAVSHWPAAAICRLPGCCWWPGIAIVPAKIKERKGAKERSRER